MLKTSNLMAALVALIAMPALAKSKEADFRVWTETDNFKPGIFAVRSTPIRAKEVKFTSPGLAWRLATFTRKTALLEPERQREALVSRG
jgi:hypothetical protein